MSHFTTVSIGFSIPVQYAHSVVELAQNQWVIKIASRVGACGDLAPSKCKTMNIE